MVGKKRDEGTALFDLGRHHLKGVQHPLMEGEDALIKGKDLAKPATKALYLLFACTIPADQTQNLSFNHIFPHPVQLKISDNENSSRSFNSERGAKRSLFKERIKLSHSPLKAFSKTRSFFKRALHTLLFSSSSMFREALAIE